MDSSITRCSEYFECRNGEKTTPEPYWCPADKPFFDAEVEDCVPDSSKCFQCSYNLDYELFAVANAPIQFIQCFKQKSLLLACPDGLEFDNRIKQCNVKQLCRTKDLTGRRCLNGGPHYEIDATDPTVYVCLTFSPRTFDFDDPIHITDTTYAGISGLTSVASVRMAFNSTYSKKRVKFYRKKKSVKPNFGFIFKYI